MNRYFEKVLRIQNHLQDHPGDYQSVISFLVNNSKAIELDRRQKFNQELGRIARYKRRNQNGK